jgi:hypothetical protein
VILRVFFARSAAGLCAVTGLLGTTGDARAADAQKAACIADAERGQDLRDVESFREAHDAFARCASPKCPALIRQDCSDWLRAVDGKSPTVAVSVRSSDGEAIAEAQATVDGTVVRDLHALLMLDPGTHAIQIDAPGYAPFMREVVLRSGEQNSPFVAVLAPVHASRTKTSAVNPGCGISARSVSVASSERAKSAATASFATTDAVGRAIDRASDPSRRAMVWASVGVAALAFTSEAYFGILASNQRSSDLSKGGCAPYCSPSETQSIQTKFIVADASLGVGLAATAASLWFALAPVAERHKETSFSVEPSRGGAVASVKGTFQ